MTSKQALTITIIFTCLCCSSLYHIIQHLRHHITNEQKEYTGNLLPVSNWLSSETQTNTSLETKQNTSVFVMPKFTKIPRAFDNMLSVAQPIALSTKPVKICVCALTRSKPKWKTLDDSRIIQNVIASTHDTTAMEWDKFEVQIFLGADADDTFWQRHADALKRQALSQYKLQVTFKFYQKRANFLPWNDLMRDGYHTGSEYLVRINDDTEFTSNGWVSLGVRTLKSFQPPNVGVVGPSCAQGNTKIMTHDMVHRTHLKIFKTYYPVVFHNWYLDDWISRVYGPARTKKIKSWTVIHHVEQQGQRYKAVLSDSNFLNREIASGEKVIDRYLQVNDPTPSASASCSLKPNVKFLSQSNEDKAMFEQFYKHPLKCAGTIVEIGALDGLTYSNSYFFERALDWKSVLVEANPQNAELLKRNRPNSITVHAAMCPEENVKFQGSGAVGGVLGSMTQRHKDIWIRKQDTIITVPCRRWGPLFKEHNIAHVDIFFIDVEGGEYSVLSVMDWEVSVDYFIIEMSSSSSTENQERIVSLLASKGYTPVSWSLKDWCTPGRDCSSNKVFSKATHSKMSTKCLYDRNWESKVSNKDLQPTNTDSSEQKLLWNIMPLVKTDGWITVDVGANRGLFSKLIEKVFGDTPSYIFEVLPKFITTLRREFAKSSVFHLAMSDKSGMSVNILGASDWNKNFNTGASILQRGPSFNKILTYVNTTSIDDFFLLKNVSISFLKIDTEGMDGRVLRGGKNMMEAKRIKSIFWESNKMQNLVGDSLLQNIIFLSNLQYDNFLVGENGNLYPIDTCPKNHRVFSSDAPTRNVLSVLRHQKIQKDKSWVVVVTVSHGFDDMFQNWLYWYRLLHLKMPVILIAEDEQTFKKYQVFDDIIVLFTEDTNKEDAVTRALNYDSHAYKIMVSRRAAHILRVMQTYEYVIYTDIDTVWLKDPRNYFTGSHDFWGQLDNSKYFCTGFMAFVRNYRTLKLLNEWNKRLKENIQLNQPIFNSILRKMDVNVMQLSRTEFPSGDLFFSNKLQMQSKKNVVIVHNNFIVGKQKKIQRFKDTHLWNPTNALTANFTANAEYCVKFENNIMEYNNVTWDTPKKICIMKLQAATILETGLVFNQFDTLHLNKWYWKKDLPKTKSVQQMKIDTVPFVSFVQIWQDTFQHIIFDTIPKVRVLCTHLQHSMDVILVQSILQQNLMIEACNLPKHRFRVIANPISSVSIAVTSWLGQKESYKMGIVPPLSFKSFGSQENEGTNVVYIPRIAGSSRSVSNEDEVLRILRMSFSNKVLVYYPKNNWMQDRKIFSQAAFIIGPHGGAMANMIFAPVNTTIIEFLPLTYLKRKGQNERPCYFGLARGMGFKYYAVEPTGFSFDSPMTVPTDKLRDILKPYQSISSELSNIPIHKPCSYIITDNEAGVFSNMMGVLSAMAKYGMHLEVRWKNKKYLSSDSSNVWTQYFKPLSTCVSNEKTPRIMMTGWDWGFDDPESTLSSMAKRIKLNKDTQEAFDSVYTWRNMSVLGVHVRSTDRKNDTTLHKQKLYALPAERYIDQIQKYLHVNPTTQKIFVASDSATILHAIKKVFGNMVESLNIKRSHNYAPIHGSNLDTPFMVGQGAILDAWLLSKTIYIVKGASQLSMFSVLRGGQNFFLLNEIDGYQRYRKIFPFRTNTTIGSF